MQTTAKKVTAASQRVVERRIQEESAPRLLTLIPGLQALRIVIEHRRALGVTRHVRHVVLERAHALFVIPCGDEACDSLGHDITWEVMAALRARSCSFESEHQCDGRIGSAPCARSIQFKLAADYGRV